MNQVFLFVVLLVSPFFLRGEELIDIRIPVVDMQDFYQPDKKEAFLKTLYQAMCEVGFFAVRNTGVDGRMIGTAYLQAETFFKREGAYKALSYDPSCRGQRGFVPGERAKGSEIKDVKEFYHVGEEGVLPENIWPDQPGFKDSLNKLYQELNRYVIPLQQAVIETINLHGGTDLRLDLLNAHTQHGNTLLRALYYPALSQEQLKDSEGPLIWGAAHTDIDLLAILPYATEKGLQVYLNDQWLNVVVPEDCFIVNVGDMLENMTNGLFMSALHRVVAQNPDKDRFSMVLFIHPTDDTALDPLPECIDLTGGIQRYAPGTRKEFLWERLLELNIAPGLLKSYSETGHTERQLEYGKQSVQVVEMLINSGLASQEVLEKCVK